MTGPINTKNSQVFAPVARQILNRVDALPVDIEERNFIKSLVTGGSAAALTAVNGCEGLRKYWATGDEPKAGGLVRLFTRMMLNRCYHEMKSAKSAPDDQLVPIADYARRLKSIFAGFTDIDANILAGLDAQYKYDAQRKPHMIHLSSLLLAAACEICGYRCLDWTKIRFPVKELYLIARSGAVIDSAPLRTTQDVNGMKNALTVGIAGMAGYQARNTIENQANPKAAD